MTSPSPSTCMLADWQFRVGFVGAFISAASIGITTLGTFPWNSVGLVGGLVSGVWQVSVRALGPSARRGYFVGGVLALSLLLLYFVWFTPSTTGGRSISWFLFAQLIPVIFLREKTVRRIFHHWEDHDDHTPGQ